jgi:hypothetical protein
LFDVLLLFEKSGGECAHSLYEVVLGKFVVLEQAVELYEAVTLLLSEDCLAEVHEFVYLLILDVDVLYEVLFHIGGSFEYGLVLFLLSGKR